MIDKAPKIIIIMIVEIGFKKIKNEIIKAKTIISSKNYSNLINFSKISIASVLL